jgi:hypothetical protein
MNIVIRHSLEHAPAIGSAGLEPSDLREGYCATLCFVTADDEFFDVHVTPRHLEQLARLLKDLERLTMAEGFLEAHRRNRPSF